jgi:hypothetical protein
VSPRPGEPWPVPLPYLVCLIFVLYPLPFHIVTKISVYNHFVCTSLRTGALLSPLFAYRYKIARGREGSFQSARRSPRRRTPLFGPLGGNELSVNIEFRQLLCTQSLPHTFRKWPATKRLQLLSLLSLAHTCKINREWHGSARPKTLAEAIFSSRGHQHQARNLPRHSSLPTFVAASERSECYDLRISRRLQLEWTSWR